VLLTACGNNSKSTARNAASASTRGSGPVKVLYAGALVDLMEKHIGPGFDKATGYTFAGTAGGAQELANQIKGKVTQADVFVSASPAINTTLEGPANGRWLSWYATLGTSDLVLGYSPRSRFAKALASKPWYEVVTEPGFRLGLTDPKLNPQGALADQAITETAAAQHLPALRRLIAPANVFPEETVVGRLQAGQLDAAFFYTTQTKAAAIPTAPLTGLHTKATFTVTVLNHAPDRDGAEAFVGYLLGPAGRALMAKDGLTLITPTRVTGTGVPPSVSRVIAEQ